MADKAVFVQPTKAGNDPLWIAVFVAVVVHLVLVLGLNFTSARDEKTAKPIEITLVNTPVKKAPETAKFLAEENQLAAGQATKKPEPPPQKLPVLNNSVKKPVKKASPEEVKPEVKPKPVQKVITQEKAVKKVVTASKPVLDKKLEKPEVKVPEEVKRPVEKKPVVKAAKAQEEDGRPHLTAEDLHQQIAQYVSEIRQSQPSPEESKIKSVDSVSTHKYVAAQYEKDWQSKVARIGNSNYPEVATQKNFSATLTMAVGINIDGSIYSIQISKSSGIPALDEAAKKIVRMGAPFAPLPMDLRKEVKVLVITRVWKFSDESGLVTR
ncbi:MAG: TonB family protein [Methylococcales bacterium]|nr:TonB family protein [Methylococcales bacterium]